MRPETWKDGVLTAVGLLMVVFGTATGNAYVMFGAATMALVVWVAFYRRQIATRSTVAVLAAVAAASAAGAYLLAR